MQTNQAGIWYNKQGDKMNYLIYSEDRGRIQKEILKESLLKRHEERGFDLSDEC